MLAGCYSRLKSWALAGGLAVGALTGVASPPAVPADTAAHWLAAPPSPARTAALLQAARRYTAHMNEQAYRYAEAARQAARAAHNPVAEGEALDALGYYWVMVPIDADRARPLLLQARRLLTRQGSPAAQARNTLHLLDLYNAIPDAGTARHQAEARAYYRLGLRQAQRAPDSLLVAYLHACRSLTYAGCGKSDSALRLVRQATRLAQQQHLPLAEVYALGVTARIFYGLTAPTQTAYYARQALRQQQRHDPAGWELLTAVDMLDLLGSTSGRQHQYQQALRYLDQQQRLVQHYHVASELPTILRRRGELYLRLHQPDSAVAAHRQAQQLLASAPSPLWYLQLENQVALARALAAQGHLAEAQRQATQARADSRRHHLPWEEANVLQALVDLTRQQGAYPQALALAEQHYHLLDSLRRSAQRSENQRLLQEMRARFDTDRAEAQVLALTRERELTALRGQRRLLALALGLVLTLALATAGVVVYRRRQQRRVQALRQQLAADLHDDVGSLLTRISMESSLLSEGLHPPGQQHQHLHNLADVSRQALRQMSDVVWSVKSDDSLPGVLTRMREHGYELLPAAGLELDFQAAADVEQAPLSAAARQHLYLIYKEALHNAVKHTQGATTVQVRLTLAGPCLHLSVQDDGAGTAAPGRPQGHGLANMRQRAEQVGGTVDYRTAPGQGFAVLVRLPLARRWPGHGRWRGISWHPSRPAS